FSFFGHETAASRLRNWLFEHVVDDQDGLLAGREKGLEILLGLGEVRGSLVRLAQFGELALDLVSGSLGINGLLQCLGFGRGRRAETTLAAVVVSASLVATAIVVATAITAATSAGEPGHPGLEHLHHRVGYRAPFGVVLYIQLSAEIVGPLLHATAESAA